MESTPPPSPPIVLVGDGDQHAAFLICWERADADGDWSAWVMWVREQDGRPVRHVVCVPAAEIEPVEPPEAYRDVPRRVRRADGSVRS
jgi:hypothetical protein